MIRWQRRQTASSTDVVPTNTAFLDFLRGELAGEEHRRADVQGRGVKLQQSVIWTVGLLVAASGFFLGPDTWRTLQPGSPSCLGAILVIGALLTLGLLFAAFFHGIQATMPIDKQVVDQSALEELLTDDKWAQPEGPSQRDIARAYTKGINGIRENASKRADQLTRGLHLQLWGTFAAFVLILVVAVVSVVIPSESSTPASTPTPVVTP